MNENVGMPDEAKFERIETWSESASEQSRASEEFIQSTKDAIFGISSQLPQIRN
jgi:hypothetical protein